MQADDFSELEQRHGPGRTTFYGGREHRTPPYIPPSKGIPLSTRHRIRGGSVMIGQDIFQSH
jgi:hypothetical protein